jgi:hypothetical protein
VILTRRGWLYHDQILPGDETVGYNSATERSEWTPLTTFHHFEDAEVWRIGNKHWHADVTPDHRWWSDSETVTAALQFEECPECGWKPRGQKKPSRGVQVHRMKIHGLANSHIPATRGEFLPTHNLGTHHRIRTSAPADNNRNPGLSLDDCAIIGWLMGDGHVRPALGEPVICPECAWLPGTGRRPHLGPVTRPGKSVARHRVLRHGLSGAQRAETEVLGWDACIYQAKPAQIDRLRLLLAGVPHTELVRDRGIPGHLPAHDFRLARQYATDLLTRVRWGDLSPEEFILSLSPDQRAAWLAAMIDAEGHIQAGQKPHHREFIRISQNDGPVAEAIVLAVYLEGWRPTRTPLARSQPQHKPGCVIGLAMAHIVPWFFPAPRVLAKQPVFSVTTGLGTWTMRQPGQPPCLTGGLGA